MPIQVSHLRLEMARSSAADPQSLSGRDAIGGALSDQRGPTAFSVPTVATDPLVSGDRKTLLEEGPVSYDASAATVARAS